MMIAKIIIMLFFTMMMFKAQTNEQIIPAIIYGIIVIAIGLFEPKKENKKTEE